MRFILILLFTVSSMFYVSGQINPFRLQFPYLDRDFSEPSFFRFNMVYLLPCPYSELIKNKHIRAIQINELPESNAPYYPYRSQPFNSFYFYFNRQGLTDSIACFYLKDIDFDSTLNVKDLYVFHYDNNSSVSSAEVFFYGEPPTKFNIWFNKDGIPETTMQTTLGDTNITKYEYNSISHSVKSFSSNHISFSHAKQDAYTEQNFFYRILPYEYIFPPDKNAGLRIVNVFNNQMAVLHDSLGIVFSQMLYKTDDENPVLVRADCFEWNGNGILLCCKSNWAHLNDSGRKTSCLFHPNITYQCILNEDNLPDTIFFDNRKTVFSYSYFDDFIRWSPCDFKGKQQADDWMEKVDKLEMIPDTLKCVPATVLYHARWYNRFILKTVSDANTYWFRNDYLVVCKTDKETFWYSGDSLVAYEAQGKDSRGMEQKIIEKAGKLRDSIYSQIKRKFPNFGMRLLLNGKETEMDLFNRSKPELVFNLKKSELDSLNTIEVNIPGFFVRNYYFSESGSIHVSGIVDLPPSGNKIADYIIKCLKNENFTNAAFVWISISNGSIDVETLYRINIHISSD